MFLAPTFAFSYFILVAESKARIGSCRIFGPWHFVTVALDAPNNTGRRGKQKQDGCCASLRSNPRQLLTITGQKKKKKMMLTYDTLSVLPSQDQRLLHTHRHRDRSPPKISRIRPLHQTGKTSQSTAPEPRWSDAESALHQRRSNTVRVLDGVAHRR